jgi:hypothetical protein
MERENLDGFTIDLRSTPSFRHISGRVNRKTIESLEFGVWSFEILRLLAEVKVSVSVAASPSQSF